MTDDALDKLLDAYVEINKQYNEAYRAREKARERIVKAARKGKVWELWKSDKSFRIRIETRVSGIEYSPKGAAAVEGAGK